MYEELVKKLRKMQSVEYCVITSTEDFPAIKIVDEAADAIEKLSHDYEKLEEDFNGAVELLHKRSKPRWIPVTERLPKDNEAVNVVWVNHNPVFYYQHIKNKPQTATGVYYRGKWYWWSAVTQDYLAEYGKWEPDLMDTAVEVTHWMPLPTPPKEETE